MSKDLAHYIPQHAISHVQALLNSAQVIVKVKRERKTKHGDYKPLSHGHHQITINANLNRYRFLITLIHEIAHLIAFETYGKRIKPHGSEWKHTFQQLMLPLINPNVFPKELLPLLAQHFKNPKASSDTDVALAAALKSYDADYNSKTFVHQLQVGDYFKLYNGRAFVKGQTRRTRVECKELNTRRVYLFNPNAEVVKYKK